MPEIEHFARSLKHRLALPLPGLNGQLHMAHAGRRLGLTHSKVPDDARIGAVLVLFYEEDFKLKLPLILRESGDTVHAGQISLPGGKVEEDDEGLEQTALRETEEEIRVLRDDVEIVGRLTNLYIPPSNFLVHPFVGIARTVPDFFPRAGEVAEVIGVTLDELMDDARMGEKEIKLSNGMSIVTPYFDLSGHAVWGATAMMLSELRIVLRELSM